MPTQEEYWDASDPDLEDIAASVATVLADVVELLSNQDAELINYQPAYQNTGDLEGATKTITAVAEGAAWGDYDYTADLTIAAPSDARLVVDRIAARLSVVCDSVDVGETLNCRVYVDAKDADHLLFDITGIGAETKLAAVDTWSGSLPVIFALLADGAAHTFRFFFWKSGDGVGDTVVSACQLWEGIGSKLNVDPGVVKCLHLVYNGIVGGDISLTQVGSGAAVGKWCIGGALASTDCRAALTSGNNPLADMTVINDNIAVGGSVATDLNVVYRLALVLRKG